MPFKMRCFKIPRAQMVEEVALSWNLCKIRNANKHKAPRLALGVKDKEVIIERFKLSQSEEPC